MCRFVLYIGNEVRLSSLVTEPENSLIHQSFDARERDEPLNGDGFGVAWYVPEIGSDAAQFRSVTPAWSNQNLQHLARMTRSGCILAHVRAASSGSAVTETNTHPFVWGRYSFMHNGEIGGFRTIKRSLLDSLGDEAYGMIEGTSDSEHLFAMFLNRLGHAREATVEEIACALEDALQATLALCKDAGVTDPSYLNVAVADGKQAAVCRFANAPGETAPSLHLHQGKLYQCENGVPRLFVRDEAKHAVIVSSETLTDDASWSQVPENHILTIDADRKVAVREMNLT